MPVTQFPVEIELSNLDRRWGFKIDGGQQGEYSGWSLGMGGDFNDDGFTDLIIAADPQVRPSQPAIMGRSYVIFGGAAVGNNGVLSLSSLNGQNGFKVEGDASLSFTNKKAGDINQDGIDDLIFKAMTHTNYLIFGHPQIGKNGTVSVLGLDGNNGFVFQGATFDASGYSFSSDADINGDSWNDLLMGAINASPLNRTEAGRAYLVFSKPGIASTGVFNLTVLNGSNGFWMDGEIAGEHSGASVTLMDDINGDGHDDILIGAYTSSPNTTSPLNRLNAGRAYVVFGGPGVGVGGKIDMANLNGTNGFKIDGLVSGDYSGLSTASGDLNGDGIVDIMLSAHGADTGGKINNGRTYVIFGYNQIGRSGSLDLATLNRSTGLMIDGENTGDESSRWLSADGDFNGDGWDDLLISACLTSPGGRLRAGSTYVVFGGPTLMNNSNGLLNLFDLNGVNGFQINGEASEDTSGYSLTSGGDFNGDGIDDFAFGAWAANTSGKIGTGRSYLIFGDVAPELLTNRLSLLEGNKIILTTQNLQATDRNHPIDALRLQASNVTRGQFEFVSIVGQAITQFTQGQVSTGQVRFVHDGGELPPSYNIQVLSDGLALPPPPQSAVINFTNVNDPPFFINNQLTLLQGETLNITNASLSADDVDSSVSSLIFYVNNLQHGVFYSLPLSRTVNNFLQNNITDGDIQFMHDGTQFPPFYQVIVSDGLTYSPAQGPVVIFNGINLAPVFVNNNLNIAEGQSVTLSTNYLNAFDTDTQVDRITFIVNDVQHGQFERFAFLGVPISSFTLQEVQQNAIRFVHDGSENPPNYTLSVTDGNSVVGPRAAVINYIPVNNPPVLINNQLSVSEGETIILDLTEISAIDRDSPVESLRFTVSEVQQGRFESVSNPGAAIASFSQQAVNSSLVRFVHDGGEMAPSYAVSVDDGLLSTLPKSAQINFTRVEDAPTINLNQLIIKEGESVLLTSSQLEIVDVDTPADEVMITPSDIQHGYFERVFNPGVALTDFSAQDLQFGFIRFSHDGGEIAPSYEIVASDGVFTTLPNTAIVSFTTINDAPILEKNQLRIAEGEVISLGSAELLASDPDSNFDDLIFTVTNVEHGQFFIGLEDQPVISFYQKNITDKAVYFIHDGSNEAPSYLTTVSDGQLITTPQTATVEFTAIDDPPILESNTLSITRGESVILNRQYLNAIDEETPSDDLIFTVEKMQHGHFEYAIALGKPIDAFSQAKVRSADIRFVHDGSEHAPNYTVSVSDGELSTAPSEALIQFNPGTTKYVSSGDTIKQAIIAGVISGGVGLMFLATRLIISYKVNQRLQSALMKGQMQSDTQELRTEFYKNVIHPIAEKIFSRIKTTGFLGYRSEQDTHRYLDAIIQLVTRLNELGVDLEMQGQSADKHLHLFNEIARHARQILVPARGYCSKAYCSSFFKAEVTPQKFEDNVETIAQAIFAGYKHKNQSAGAKIEMVDLQDDKERVVAVEPQASYSPRLLGRQQRSSSTDERFAKIENQLKKIDQIEEGMKRLEASVSSLGSR